MEEDNQMDEMDTNFLTQFSSMVTTDKDDLIKQFQTIGENLNYSTATFFLDMSNWNLQTAVGCYFDFMVSRLPSMKFLNDLTVGKDEKVTPNTGFKLSWLLQNDGESVWHGTYLRNETDDKKYYLPSLSPNDTTVVTVDLISPPTPGLFVTKWSLYTANGSQFGETITSAIDVCEGGTLAITQQLQQLQAVSAPPPDVELSSVSSENLPSGSLEDTEMWG